MKTKKLLFLLSMLVIVTYIKGQTFQYLTVNASDEEVVAEISSNALYAKLDSMQIKRTIADDKIILTKNGFKCILTPTIIRRVLAGKSGCVQVMSQSIANWLLLLKQAEALALKSGKYVSRYQSKLLLKSDLLQWRNTVMQCDALLNRMSKLPYASEQDYNDQLPSMESVRLHSAILDVVTYSKATLGL